MKGPRDKREPTETVVMEFFSRDVRDILFVYNPTTTHYEVTVQYKVNLLNNNETRTLNKHANLRTTTPSPPSAIFKKRINNTEN